MVRFVLQAKLGRQSLAAMHRPTKRKFSYLVDNLPDLWFKTHIQHPISLIQDKVCDALQVGDT